MGLGNFIYLTDGKKPANLTCVIKSQESSHTLGRGAVIRKGQAEGASVVIQLLSCVQLFVAQWTAAHQASLSFTEFAQTHVHGVSDTTKPSHLLSSPSPPTLNLSQHQGLFQ